MELIIFVVFVLLLGLASATGHVADSRDYADWIPTREGFRDVRRW